MVDLLSHYKTPPPCSPWARPALGVALALNMLLAAGVHLGMAFATSVKIHDELTLAIMHAAPVIYLALLLPIAALYGMATAAWTGWSWWRVPFATLAGTVLALGLNALAMAQWMSRQGWQVDPIMSIADSRLNHLLFLAGVSLFVLLATSLSLWPRWFRDE